MQSRESIFFSREQTLSLKGIAILLVILGHMGYLDISGAWGVHIFLIVSGYGIYMSVMKNGLKDYWKKRIVAVYVPYLCWQIIGMVIMLFVLKIQLTSQQILLSLAGLDFGLIADRTMWYISYIFYWYFAFWVTMRVKEKWNLSVVTVIAAIAFTGGAAVIGYTNLVWGHGSIAWAYFLSFPLGIVCAFMTQKKIESKSLIIFETVMAVVMAVFFIFDYGNVHTAFNEMLFSMSAAGLVLLLVLNFSELFGGGQRLLCCIGKYSFGMYLNEGILLKIQGEFLTKMNRHISNLFILAGSFIFAVVVDKYMVLPITKKIRDKLK